jgi:manganese efflux pump family protein
MHLLSIILITLLLSLVPFSVAAGTSIYRCIVRKEALRIALAFAVFQALMTALGWVIGFGIKSMLADLFEPVAALIIFFTGIRIFLDSRKPEREHRIMKVENMKILLIFSVIISINTAMLGMGLGIIYDNVLILSGLIFALVFIAVILGVRAGKRGMMNIGKSAELLSGTGLIMVSIVIILQFLKII